MQNNQIEAAVALFEDIEMKWKLIHLNAQTYLLTVLKFEIATDPIRRFSRILDLF